MGVDILPPPNSPMKQKTEYIIDNNRYTESYVVTISLTFKTVELPKSSEEPNLDVEDIATLHLDMIAYDEGYN